MRTQWLGWLSIGLTGCFSSWEVKDVDGDGVSGVEDCWESTEDPVPPSGAMVSETSISAQDIFVGAEDRPYDGIDQNCDGLDDFDQDVDGFIPNEYVGIITLGLEQTGTLSGGDCDDDDPSRHPDTIELCDGLINGCENEISDNEVDNDGDGYVECSIDDDWMGSEVVGGDDCDDEDALLFPSQNWYLDEDLDEFGDPDNATVSCEKPEGYILDNTDCDDADATISPTTLELCDGLINVCGTELSNDEVDDDGDGYVECTFDVDGWDGTSSVIGGDDCSDQDASVFVSTTYFIDVDQDGFGDPNSPLIECEQPSGFVLDDNDCNDDDATVYFNAPELCDGQLNSCIGTLSTNEIDDDGDGFVDCTIDGGGWDGDSSVFDGDDCDDYDANEQPDQIWYADLDNDGFGNGSTNMVSCLQPLASSLDNTDCDDTDSTVFPTANELCDGQVNDCGTPLSSDEVDADGDGVSICVLDNGGWDGLGTVSSGGDCDDSSSATYPGAANFDSISDCMVDEDGDGYGGTSPQVGVVSGTDCNDSDATIFPTAQEVCDGQVNSCGGNLPSNEVDNDNDGFVECIVHEDGWDGINSVIGGEDCNDSNDDEFPTQIWFEDNDQDGIGSAAELISCLQPSNGVLDTGDCDDLDDTVFPNAQEVCDGQVNACGGNLPSNEVDNDNDGYVECVVHSEGWDGGSILGGDDCDDAEILAYPGAASAESPTVCMLDSDLDGFGDDTFGQAYTSGSDCNDSDDSVYLGASELCDGQVNNCYSSIPLNEIDTDGDGYIACVIDSDGWDGSSSVVGGEDCNTTNGQIYPYADEDADSTDDNCDGMESLFGLENCEGGLYTGGGVEKYFLFCDENLTPDIANVRCTSTGYDALASISSPNELSFTVDIAKPHEYFIGMTRSGVGSPWSWRDGSNSTYTYNNTDPSGSGTDVLVRTDNNGIVDWRAKDSGDLFPFLCSTTF